MSGWLPPGCTDRDVDEACPGYWDEEEEEMLTVFDYEIKPVEVLRARYSSYDGSCDAWKETHYLIFAHSPELHRRYYLEQYSRIDAEQTVRTLREVQNNPKTNPDAWVSE